MNSYPIGWESITPVIHKRNRYVDESERVWRLRNRYADDMETGKREWDYAQLAELENLAVMLFNLSCGEMVVELSRCHNKYVPQELNFVTALEAK